MGVPVTGDIADLPLPELLNMMRFRSGKLALLQTQQVSEMTLHFTPGYLCGFMVDKYIVKNETQVVDKLVAVTASPKGRFVFTPAHASSLLGSVRLGIDRLALIIVSQVDEISVNKAQLSPPHRIFRLQPGGAKVQFEEQNLAEFFHSAKELLRCGISAEKLASIEQISTEQVQLYLYKLSLLGLVAPGRRDDLWAELDTVLQSKSTALKVTAAQRTEAGETVPAAATASKLWGSSSARAGRREAAPKEKNEQRAVATLIRRSGGRTTGKPGADPGK
jgi:hypothetical protein